MGGVRILGHLAYLAYTAHIRAFQTCQPIGRRVETPNTEAHSGSRKLLEDLQL